jgi:multiple sugar transport system substrate-binding protein
MRKSLFVFLTMLLFAGLLLVACGGSQPAEEPAVEEPAVEEPAAEEPAVEEPAAEEPAVEEPAAEEPMGDKVQIRWFVGLGTGTDPEQVEAQEQVVADFNASQDEIELVLEIVPYDSARDTLATQIASGSGPDIVGPVGVGGSNAFFGQWLDLTPQIEASGFDLSIFNPALVDFYQTEEGQVGLPFAVFPAAVYYIPEMFDELDLAYPPSAYGEQYELDGEMVDWNWDTLTEVAKRLTIDVNGLNAVEDGFDATQLVQVGYAPNWQTDPPYIGSYYAGGAKMYEGNAPGEYVSTFPDEWKEALQWFYDGMYGEQPYIATGPLSGAPEFGNGNIFNSGKAAMAITPLWYTCCLGELRDAGVEFQAGALPMGADGEVHGRVDADTFRIWTGTKHPEEAFTVLSYLLTDAGDTLLPIYGALPAIPEKQEAFFEAKSADYPFVTQESWDIFAAGLAYPDTPSAEQYQPNWNEAWARGSTFSDLLQNTPPEDLDFEAEYQKFIDDLTAIYNKE